MNKRRSQRESSIAEGDEQHGFVTLGRVSGVQGLKGGLKIYSDTSPRENIAGYSPWYLNLGDGWKTWEVISGRRQGKLVVVRLKGCNDRDAAEELIGATIAVTRDQLPDDTEEGEFYWTDLTGLSVVTPDGVELGKIDYLFETGANDVMVVKGSRERLIPYIWEQVVREVDLVNGRMVVDWDPEF